jgi:hypothetical protein
MSFAAKHPDECSTCGSSIEPGEQVQYTDDDDLVHAHCEASPVRTDAEVCQVCWMTKPCWCEEKT